MKNASVIPPSEGGFPTAGDGAMDEVIMLSEGSEGSGEDADVGEKQQPHAGPFDEAIAEDPGHEMGNEVRAAGDDGSHQPPGGAADLWLSSFGGVPGAHPGPHTIYQPGVPSQAVPPRGASAGPSAHTPTEKSFSRRDRPRKNPHPSQTSGGGDLVLAKKPRLAGPMRPRSHFIPPAAAHLGDANSRDGDPDCVRRLEELRIMVDDHGGDLGEGWTVWVKYRASGDFASARGKDFYYNGPNGEDFRSKKSVVEYLCKGAVVTGTPRPRTAPAATGAPPAAPMGLGRALLNKSGRGRGGRGRARRGPGRPRKEGGGARLGASALAPPSPSGAGALAGLGMIFEAGKKLEGSAPLSPPQPPLMGLTTTSQDDTLYNTSRTLVRLASEHDLERLGEEPEGVGARRGGGSAAVVGGDRSRQSALAAEAEAEAKHSRLLAQHRRVVAESRGWKIMYEELEARVGRLVSGAIDLDTFKELMEDTGGD